MSFAAAAERVLALVGARLGAEQVHLAASVGRVLAETFDARLSLPGFDQSAMDGYAVRGADLTPGACLPVTGRTVWFTGTRPCGQSARVRTVPAA